MKKQLFSLIFFCFAAIAAAQDPKTDKNPASHNYDNALFYCDNVACPTIAQRAWEWDCSMGCIKPGEKFKNMSETDCNGVTKKAYDVMANGKPLMILWEGWDCGNCRGNAPKVSDYIKKNKDKINFWMPYGGIGGGAKCGPSSDNKTPAEWQKSYDGFANAFSFLDNDFTYIYGYHSLPQYSLVNPVTKEMVIITSQNEGNDPWGRIAAAADKLLTTITNTQIANEINAYKLFPNPTEDMITIDMSLVTSSNVKISIVNMLGKEVIVVQENMVTAIQKNINLTGIASGIYNVNTIVNGKFLKAELLQVK